MTRTQRKLIEVMREAIASGEWTKVGGNTIRYTETCDTPESIPAAWYSHPTYRRYVFLTFTHGGPILGVDPCPWVEARNESVTYKRAFAVLADPSAVFG